VLKFIHDKREETLQLSTVDMHHIEGILYTAIPHHIHKPSEPAS